MEIMIHGFCCLCFGLFLSLVGGFFWILPLSVQRSFGAKIGILLSKCGYRKKVIDFNLKIAFPHLHQKGERERIQKNCYEHFGKLIVEFFIFFTPWKKNWKKQVEVLHLDYFEQAKSQNKGVFILTSHLGNWELMATVGQGRDLKLMALVKKVKPSWLNFFVERGRRSVGLEISYEPRNAKDVLLHLKKKKTVAVLLDQYAGPPIGVRVPLFGVPVGTSTGFAALVKRTGAPVLAVKMTRTEKGHRVSFEKPLPWIKDSNIHKELALNTAQYVATIERHILENPEQWLWMHRRFKGNLAPLEPEEWATPRLRTSSV